MFSYISKHYRCFTMYTHCIAMAWIICSYHISWNTKESYLLAYCYRRTYTRTVEEERFQHVSYSWLIFESERLLSESDNCRQGLRSASDPGIRYDILFNEKTRFNDRRFCTIGPILWNNLSLYIKQSVSIDVLKPQNSLFWTVSWLV